MSYEQKTDQQITKYSINVSNPFVPKGPYRDAIKPVLEMLFRYLDNKEKIDIIYNKLMLENEKVEDRYYIQAACEVTICAWFAYIATMTKERYEYEFVVSKPKDVDCAIWDNENQFNIEVKCADYSKHKNIVANSDLIMHGLGRLTEYKSSVSNLQNILSTGSEPTILGESHHMDCKMKDFLLSAQEKFGVTIVPNHLNVLFVCVDCQMDMMKWISYLNGAQGLFTEESFKPRENYDNVDVVVFTNLYHRHYKTEEKNKISDHWNLEKSFNFLIKNPRSTKKDSLIDIFCKKTPLENYDFQEFLKGFLENTTYPKDIASSMALNHFVGEQAQKGIHKFQGYGAGKNV